MPHMLRARLVSSRGDTATPAAVFSPLISSGSVTDSSPLGPLTFTVCPSTAACTLAGTGTGRFPMRDMARFSSFNGRRGQRRSEYVTQDLAADLLLAGACIRHHAFRGRQDRDAEPVAHRRQ